MFTTASLWFVPRVFKSTTPISHWGRLSLWQKWVQRIFSWSKGGRCVELTTLPPSCADCLKIVEASTSWNPRGLRRPVQGQLYLYFPQTIPLLSALKLFDAHFHVSKRARTLTHSLSLTHTHTHTQRIWDKIRQKKKVKLCEKKGVMRINGMSLNSRGRTSLC